MGDGARRARPPGACAGDPRGAHGAGAHALEGLTRSAGRGRRRDRSRLDRGPGTRLAGGVHRDAPGRPGGRGRPGRRGGGPGRRGGRPGRERTAGRADAGH
ncbi:MAG: hypothetical protein E6K81_00525 [Candidatus Eisenbacteria bacterium]|uniref:Uncharacterized protein n=1 Tax=Eiseniibacteriota bacterium TaxID=2212470 RepID=A0A538UEC6_UNCEI|nr:MAG: hypothetical protein E6K81_00525 [Candidatus Eisenbacteria bacterium]